MAETMTDPRTTPDPALVSLNEPMQIAVSVSDLYRAPDGKRDRQLIYGEQVTVLHRTNDWSLLRAEKDGYCGYVRTNVLCAPRPATHTVTARSTQAYAKADIKSADLIALTFGSRVTARSETPTFIETELGYIPRQHLHRVSDTATDFVAIAEKFVGTPYLWGGNSAWGIDCSGLLQAACLACDIPCPGDSDQQFQSLGKRLPDSTPWQRGDMLFWKGHVAIVTDPQTLFHSNAGYMIATHEGIASAITRIAQQGDGDVTAHKRF